MAEINIGDHVRIKNQENWPSPPGYRLANAEGTVVKWIEYEEPMEEFKSYIPVKIEKAENDAAAYIGNIFFFREEYVEKI